MPSRDRDCEMNPASISRRLWALLLAEFTARVTVGMDEELKHCDSASFFLESEDLIRINVSTCFTQISWDQVELEEKRK